MRGTGGPIVLGVLATTLGPGGALAQPPLDTPSFQSRVELIRITATVRDAEGHLVRGLPPEAFEVYEDGDVQHITQFTDERVPVSLALALDVSDSMYGQRIEDARTAVERFLFDLLAPSDEFLVLAFSHRPWVLTEWTRSPDVVRPALEGLRPFGGTSLYDAILTGLPLLQARGDHRTALLVISDGADSASDADLNDVRSALLRTEAFTYAIAIDSPETRSINTAVNPTALRDITDGSGGRTEVVQSTNDLIAATARIAEELNNQYLLGYNSPHGPDGRYHSIRVRVQGEGYQVRARNGYVAASR